MKISLDWIQQYCNVPAIPAAELSSRFTLGVAEVEGFVALEKPKKDLILEVDNKSLTHRPDLWGHYGLAREFATVFEAELKPHPVQKFEWPQKLPPAPLQLTIETPQDCRRYMGVVLKGVTVAPSPLWLQERLMALGETPINNLVDVTNYVMYDLGQPLHAFDFASIEGATIKVRRAKLGEKITLLDDKEYELCPDDLVIADAHAPKALAGIMGGKQDSITAQTQEIFIESANFVPEVIRKTSVRLGVRSDASQRFEKTLDPEAVSTALKYCVDLLLQICPGSQVAYAPVEAYPSPFSRKQITFKPQQIINVLGSLKTGEISVQQIGSILLSLGFGLTHNGQSLSKESLAPLKSQDEITLQVPTFRATKDVDGVHDIVEEIGRIIGFDRIKPQAPTLPVKSPHFNHKRQSEWGLKAALVAGGHYHEVFNYPLVSESLMQLALAKPPEVLAKINLAAHPQILKLANPISVDQQYMRLSLMPGLLLNAQKNLAHFDVFGLFELGRTYQARAGHLGDADAALHGAALNPFVLHWNPVKDLAAVKPLRLAALEKNILAGIKAFPKQVYQDDFFQRIKGQLVDGLKVLKKGIPQFLVPAHGDALPHFAHPYRVVSVVVQNTLVGYLYQVHPSYLQLFKRKVALVAWEIDFDLLYSLPQQHVRLNDIPKFPEASFDLTLMCPPKTYAQPVALQLKKVNELVHSVRLVSEFISDAQSNEGKSLSFHFKLQKSDGTPSTEEVKKVQFQMVAEINQMGFALKGDLK